MNLRWTLKENLQYIYTHTMILGDMCNTIFLISCSLVLSLILYYMHVCKLYSYSLMIKYILICFFQDTDCCTRICCGPARAFEMKILDNSQREVIHLSRPFRCTACCFPCCLQELEVCSPPGTPVGYVVQK